jgi:hypothetical protein
MIRDVLTEIGFKEVEWIDERGVALANAQPPTAGKQQVGAPVLAAQLVLGPQLPEMVRNVAINLAEDRLTLVQAVFERS